jgi:hypothetical protein
LGGNTMLVQADVSDKNEARGMVQRVIDEWGGLHQHGQQRRHHT